jgi:hypothetical protein
LAEASNGQIALLWRTEWESEGEAAEFEEALTKARRCWRDNEIATTHRRLRIRGAPATRREAKSVLVTRGLGSTTNAGLEALARLAVEHHAAEPVSELRVPERRPVAPRRPGVVSGDRYRSDWLGLSARLPSGMVVSVGKDDHELHIARREASVVGRMVLSDRIASPEFNAFTFRQIAEAFRDALGGARLQPAWQGRWRSPLGDAIEQGWQVVGTSLSVRAILVPICDGNGSLVFLEAYADDYARQVLDGWLMSFRWQDRAAPPVCSLLAPE